MEDIKKALKKGLDQQPAATAEWHASTGSLCTDISGEVTLERCILAQHACNFTLWHIEDDARQRDVGDDVIADCKRRIDAMNQKRNDRMEGVDKVLYELMLPLLPQNVGQIRHNTESMGMAIDRMSILSLKIWHMDEQLLRTDVDPAHLKSCADKAAVLRQQRNDLEQAIMDLLDDFACGSMQPKLYFQFKMYNDPSLNPKLYASAKPA